MPRVKASLAVGLAFALGVPTLAACTRTIDATRAIGLPCTTTADCSNVCLPRTVYPGGFCSRACQIDGECPVASSCATGFCLFSCFDDDDCSLLVEGWSCRDLAGKLVCAPDSLTLPDAGATSDGP
jgi:hypothetical protein